MGLIFSIFLFVVGLMYANVVEYSVHRYLFHGLGKSKNSIFAFHLRGHHLVCRKNDFLDLKISFFETFGVFILILLQAPIYFILPYMFYGITTYGILFVLLHNYMHKKPEFAKKYFPWHWNHHMKNQNKSWGVVLPVSDILTGTLEK